MTKRYFIDHQGGCGRVYWYGSKFNGRWHWRVPFSNTVYSPGWKAWLSDTWATIRVRAKFVSRPRIFACGMLVGAALVGMLYWVWSANG